MEGYLGRYTNIETTCIFSEGTGQWKVTQKLTHKRSLDGEHWEEKSLSMQSYATDLGVALTNVLFSIETYLARRNHDLFVELPNTARRDD